MRFTVDDDEGHPVSFECPDTFSSRWTSGAILEGRTYPHLPFIEDVSTILDVGANCGATSVHLARHHPDAVVHAFEPGREARRYLERNVGDLPNVVVHPFGLDAVDREALLFVDDEDIGQASVITHVDGAATAEAITLRSAAGWAAAAGIDRIDILKVDVEGCEVEVLEGLAALLPTVKVLYIEYDSRQARRRITQLLDVGHDLYYAALMTLDQGECCFVRRAEAGHPDAIPRVRQIFSRSLVAR